MGQRHQVFLIARVVPHGQPSEAQYRCIAALHHQWTYGCLALKAITRFITLVKQEDNAEIILDEIRTVSELYGSLEPPVEEKLPRVLCPYLQFLACTAWCVHLTDEPYEGMYGPDSIILPVSMASFGGDNNDGITIIDMTNPESPSYCFVDFSRPKPITARQYVRKYYPEPTDSDNEEDEGRRKTNVEIQVKAALRPLESIPLISTDVLEEVWPSDYRTVQKRISISTPPNNGANDAPPVAVDIVKRISEPIDALQVKKYLLAQDQIPDAILNLFPKIIEFDAPNGRVVDLSKYRLKDEQIIKILLSQASAEVLKLSHNQAVTMALIQRVLPTLPKLRRLVVLNTSITTDEVKTAFRDHPKLFHGLEAFIHPAFNAFYPGAPESPPFAFTHISLDGSQRDLDATSLPYFTTPQVLQGLIDYLSPLLTPENGFMFFTSIRLSRYSVKAVYASELRKEHQSWEQRVVPFVPQSPLEVDGTYEGWIFVLLHSIFGVGNKYGFCRIIKTVVDELRQELKALRTKGSLTGEEKSLEEAAIHGSYSTKVGTAYDLHGFLEQLGLEGRDPPPPEQQSKMEEIFAGIERGQEYYHPFSKLTSEDLLGVILDSDAALEWQRVRARNYQY